MAQILMIIMELNVCNNITLYCVCRQHGEINFGKNLKNLRKKRKRPSDKEESSPKKIKNVDPAEHQQSLSVLKEEMKKKKPIKKY